MTDERISPEYCYEFDVESSAIDTNGHVNNVVYLQWMQDAAVKHAKSVIAKEIYSRLNCTWVARSHHIEYLSPAFSGDRIVARTWLVSFRRVRCIRRYEFVRLSDQKLLARGESDWVLIATDTGKPKSIPSEITDAFADTDGEHSASD